MQEEGNHILILFAISALLILIIIILAFVFLLSYQKKLVSQKLQIQKGESEFQQQLLVASIDAQEKERKRIASDLHDDFGSLLSGLKLNINYLKTIDKVGAPEKEFLTRTGVLIDDGLSNVRRISYDLLPPTLIRFGLWEALRELIKDVNYNNQIRAIADFKNISISDELPEKTQLSLFRILKELIANSLHEDSVSEIRIHCKEENSLIILYQDNGNGFTDTSQPQGLGMINMQSRIRSINGKMELSSEEDQYFFANISIPLNE
jgi:signal transduction histidine kinase